MILIHAALPPMCHLKKRLSLPSVSNFSFHGSTPGVADPRLCWCSFRSPELPLGRPPPVGVLGPGALERRNATHSHSLPAPRIRRAARSPESGPRGRAGRCGVRRVAQKAQASRRGWGARGFAEPGGPRCGECARVRSVGSHSPKSLGRTRAGAAQALRRPPWL